MQARRQILLIALCGRAIVGGRECCASHQPPAAAARVFDGAAFANSLK